MGIDVEGWRSAFRLPSSIHLNQTMTGAVPERVLSARREAEREWIETDPHPWFAWRDQIGEFRRRVAGLLNASPSEIAVVPSATQGMAQIASCFDFDAGENVVTTGMEYPSALQFWSVQERRRGAQMRIATKNSPGLVTASDLAARTDDRTAIVQTSSAFSATGGMLDTARAASVAAETDSLLMVDAYQSVGAVDTDVKASGVDVLLGGTLKYLLGGPGLAFIYVDESLCTELEPATLGWFGAAEKFATEEEKIGYAADATRFQLGTPPMLTVYQANAGLDVIQEIGTARIEARLDHLTRLLIDGARNRGFEVLTPTDPDARTGFVSLRVPDCETIVERMADRGVRVSWLRGRTVGPAVRLAPHFYNTEGEIEQALDALDAAAPRAARTACSAR